ncbi:polysaccharide biosynthesis C-terminal domain-containing protein [Paenibacillus sepulcri]|uniref:Polysaccharide biosynthesis C-terminal domain-containing protein n=1 Tax=Paenibacillus sepulcri TaxID=359917 RepID=A0ABS7BV54_9BACL|nr:polysaccharide biosynthesis C-terminal domain-containing protein [Paenibacillus sepulcri]
MVELATARRISSKTVKDIITTVLTRGVTLFGGFLISVLLARFLGAEGRGVVTVIFLVPTLMFTIAELGVRQATAYFVGQKAHEFTDIIKTTYLIWIVMSIISLLIVSGYYGLFYYGKYSGTLLLIALLSVPFTLFTRYTNGILQGKDRIGNINNLELWNTGLNITFVVVLVGLLRLDILGATLVNFLLALMIAVQSYLMVRKLAPFQIGYIKGLPVQFIKKGIAYALALFVLQLNYRINIMMLEQFSDVRSIGIFTVGTVLAELIWQLPAAVGMVLFAKSANSKTEQEAINRAAKLLRMLLPVALAVCVFIALFSSVIVNILYGKEFADAAQVIRLLLPGIFIMFFFKVLNADLAGRGKPLFALAAYILPLILNVVLNFIFIPLYNINGTAMASSISYVIGGLLFLVIYSRNTGVKIKDLLIMKRSDLKR